MATGRSLSGSRAGDPEPGASLRNLLVFQQVAASMVLLLLTGFVVVGWQRSAGADVGFDTAQLYRLALDSVRDGYTPERAKDSFLRSRTGCGAHAA